MNQISELKNNIITRQKELNNITSSIKSSLNSTSKFKSFVQNIYIKGLEEIKKNINNAFNNILENELNNMKKTMEESILNNDNVGKVSIQTMEQLISDLQGIKCITNKISVIEFPFQSNSSNE